MSKTNRSVHYITSIPNTIEGLKILADLREALKKKGLGTRVYGRCKNKRKVFEKNGRKYHPWYGENVKNDISLRSAEATDCYEWAVYFSPKRQRIVKPENLINIPFGGDTGIDADYPTDSLTKEFEVPIEETTVDLFVPEIQSSRCFTKEEIEEAFR
jgi:hypothetical protein